MKHKLRACILTPTLAENFNFFFKLVVYRINSFRIVNRREIVFGFASHCFTLKYVWVEITH